MASTANQTVSALLSRNRERRAESRSVSSTPGPVHSGQPTGFFPRPLGPRSLQGYFCRFSFREIHKLGQGWSRTPSPRDVQFPWNSSSNEDRHNGTLIVSIRILARFSRNVHPLFLSFLPIPNSRRPAARQPAIRLFLRPPTFLFARYLIAPLLP